MSLFGPIRQLLLCLALAVIFGFSLLPIALAVPGTSFTLYDGSLGTYPGDQGFIYLPKAISATQTLTTGGITLDTTLHQADQAGYFSRSTSVPTLDRTRGFTISFTVQVITETHANNNRAGFSIIALSDDLAGIELGFWTNEIWAQEGGQPPLFTHAEGVTTNTMALTSYHLAIQGSTYTLLSGPTSILTGSLRNYSTCSCVPNPYTTPNFLFLGDDTGSAKARVKLTSVSIITNPANPIVGLDKIYLPVILKNSSGTVDEYAADLSSVFP